MADDYPPEFSKREDESYTRAIDFTGLLPDGRALASATLSATDGAQADATAIVLVDTNGIIGTGANAGKVYYTPKGGTNGICYEILCHAVLDNGEVLEEVVRMHVEEFPS